MAKFAGLSCVFTVDSTGGTPTDVSNSVSTIAIKGSVGEQVVTGLDKLAEERLQLIEDAEYTITGRGYPPAAHRAVLWESMRTTRTISIDLPDSATVGAEVFFFGLEIGRGDDASGDWSLTMRINNGTAPAWT